MIQSRLITKVFVILLLSHSFKYAFSTDDEEEFDFIVVGSGSAGSVITNRLVKDGKYKVLLLEKGGHPSVLTEVPALAPVMYYTGCKDEYQVEKQDGQGDGYTTGRLSWYKGKCLGGSSSVNFLAYTRCHRSDYDRWAALGNPGWSYEEVLPLFKAIEKAKIPNIDSNTRGLDGEIDCEEVSHKTDSGHAFVKACQEVGLKYLEDYNSGHPMGVGYLQSNTRDGWRCHSEKAFLRPVKDNGNLKIETDSSVTRLIVNPDTKTVEGVEYEKYGQLHNAKARKEVILSAGVFASAQILMLSGIGPKRHLEKQGIKVIKDLPVGRFISDHITFQGLVFEMNTTVGSSLGAALNPINWFNFLVRGKGHLTLPVLTGEAMAFVKTPLSDATADYPDVEYAFASGSLSTDYGILTKRALGLTSEAYGALFAPYEGTPTWTTLVVLLHPKSKGYLELRSKNPHDPPKMYANYFTDPDGIDMKTMVAAIRIIQKIAKAPSLAQYGSKVSLNSLPNCVDFVPDSDEFWECQVKNIFSSIWHQSGTCKMGPENDTEAVVDNELRVYGINNLRVADTSVIPITLSGHTHIPASMVGEKAARLILERCEDQMKTEVNLEGSCPRFSIYNVTLKNCMT